MAASSDKKKRAIVIATVVFIVLMFVPVVIGALYAQTDAAFTAQVFTQHQTLTDLGALAVKIKLDHLVGIATAMATSSDLAADIAHGKWDAASAVTRDLQNNISYYDPYIDRIIIFDASGTQQAAYPELVGGIGKNASTSGWYQALASGQAYSVSNVSKRTSIPQINVVNIALPVTYQGTVAGFLVMQVPTDNFLEFGSNLTLGTYGFAYLVDRAGNLIAHPKFSSDDGGVLSFTYVPAVQKVIAGEEGTVIMNDQGDSERSIITYKPVPTYGWGVVTQELYDEAFSAKNGILFSLELEMIAISVINLLVAYVVFRSLTHRPPVGKKSK